MRDDDGSSRHQIVDRNRPGYSQALNTIVDDVDDGECARQSVWGAQRRFVGLSYFFYVWNVLIQSRGIQLVIKLHLVHACCRPVCSCDWETTILEIQWYELVCYRFMSERGNRDIERERREDWTERNQKKQNREKMNLIRRTVVVVLAIAVSGAQSESIFNSGEQEFCWINRTMQSARYMDVCVCAVQIKQPLIRRSRGRAD